MEINFKLILNDISIKIIVSDREPICEYTFLSKKTLTERGKSIIKTTLLSWAMLDFSSCTKIIIETDLTEFEKDYLEKNYFYCSKLYSKVYEYRVANISWNSTVNIKYENVIMNDKYYLGYTNGKDSTLCKILLEEAKKEIEYYKISYDDEKPADDGHVYCYIIDKEKYSRYTITGHKGENKIISFQQSDDIHVTFACPYIYEKNEFAKFLAVGIPWDAIHCFKDITPDLVPTETYYSIVLFEKLMYNYGFQEFKIVSPIATLHTYGVYTTLSKILSIDKLLKLDSCWDSYDYDGDPCGYCPKCQRLKKVFNECFQVQYIENVPQLNINNADFLFGSMYAKKVLDIMNKDIIMNSMLVDKTSKLFSLEFMEILENKYFLKQVEVEDMEFNRDEQTWSDIIRQLTEVIGLDYSLLNDEICNNLDVPYLPFEKYYKWNRKNKILNCYNIIKYFDTISKKWEYMYLSDGNKKLVLNERLIFLDYVKKSRFKKIKYLTLAPTYRNRTNV